MNLEEHVINRNWLAEKVRAEVVGPDPSGDAVITPKITRLPDCTWADFRTPKKQLNGEEILWQDSPLKRYGAGILYPAGSRLTEIEGENVSDEHSSMLAYYFKYLLINQVITFLIMRYDRHCTRH